MPVYDMTTWKRLDTPSSGSQLVLTFDEKTGKTKCRKEKLPEKVPEFSYEDLKKWGQSKPKEVKVSAEGRFETMTQFQNVLVAKCPSCISDHSEDHSEGNSHPNTGSDS